jgi:hypothetical protein
MTIRADNRIIPPPAVSRAITISTSVVHIDLKELFGTDYNQGDMYTFQGSVVWYAYNDDQPTTAVDSTVAWDPTDSGDTIDPSPPQYAANVPERVFIPNGRHYLHVIGASGGVLRAWKSSANH